MFHRGEREHRHESFGVARVNQNTHSGGQNLFGSPVSDHFQTFSLTIERAVAVEDAEGTGAMSIHGEGPCLISISMSAAQFLELITSHNRGEGIPCTITRFDRKLVPPPPRPPTDVERAHGAFEGRMRQLADRLDEYIERVSAAASKLPKRDQDALRREAAQLRQEIAQNIPFFLRTFTEAAERIVTAKKAEVDAWLSGVVRAAGLERLRALARSEDERDALALPVRADDPPNSGEV